MDEELKIKFSDQVKDQMANIITSCIADFLDHNDDGVDDEDFCLIQDWVKGWVKTHIDPISKEDYDKEVEERESYE